MKAQFNLINKSNQSIKLLANISDKSSTKKNFQIYRYNNNEIFKYVISIKDSKIELNINLLKLLKNSFSNKLIGSFIYDISNKYSATQVDINTSNKNILENIVLGLCQKDFIYSIYKKNSKKSIYQTKFKLSKINSNTLQSINFLKELVSEPSNISTQILQNINNLDAIVSGGTPPYSFLWNTNEITSTITPNINGMFWLLVYDDNGCVSDTSFVLYDNMLTNSTETLYSNKINRVLDLFGREIKINTYQRILLYIYNDGRVERKFVIY